MIPETPEMDRYDQFLLLMHRWLAQLPLEAPAGPSNCDKPGILWGMVHFVAFSLSHRKMCNVLIRDLQKSATLRLECNVGRQGSTVTLLITGVRLVGRG